MTNYRRLTSYETEVLEAQGCIAADWTDVLVTEGFSPEYVRYTRFSGTVRLGSFEKEFKLPGGMKKHSGN